MTKRGFSKDSLAVAVEYRRESMESPVVSARGSAEVAREMRRAAVRYGVPIVDDPALAEKLSRSKESQAIDQSLFEEVAELFLRLERPLKR